MHPESKDNELQGAALRNLQEIMNRVKFLILDEYSMVGSKSLAMMDSR